MSSGPNTRRPLPMKDFSGRIAVITGGGTGIGRELARQLVANGCNIAMCDVSAANMEKTKALCEAVAAQGARISTFIADVSDAAAVQRFRDATAREHETDRIHLLFNNAGIGGGGSFVAGERSEWERTFNVCWGGVYNCARAFMPMMVAADEARIVNISSINGIWASLGPGIPHTAYAAAKFAVKGFSEALMTDLSVNAPHVKCSVVMPGHVGTDIVTNTRKVQSGNQSETLDTTEFAETARRFRDDALTTSAQAATTILDGVKAERWRILVGEDAQIIDERVRGEPEEAYELGFYERLPQKARWQVVA